MRQPGRGVIPVLARGYGRLPLTFEANLGQTDGQVRFLTRGGGYTLFLTGQEAVLSLGRGDAKEGRDALRISLAGANPSPRVVGLEEQPGKSNYFIGSDPAKWRTNVPHYAKVEYEAVYPGIDLVYYGNEQRLEHDFVVAAGADPNLIRLKFTGAKEVRTDAAGNLVLKTKGGEVALQAPVIYQEVDGERRPVTGKCRLTAKNEAAFEVGSYDRRLALVIDPVLVYSTYLGGGGNDFVSGIARCDGITVDPTGVAYVTGTTYSTDFPTLNAYQTDQGSYDAFVTKLSPDGATLEYSTYLGGSGGDYGCAIALDPSGSTYVSGLTYSSDFPINGAYQSAPAGSADIYVSKLDPSGSSLVYSTYLGGGGYDSTAALAVDSSGNAYVAGTTSSSDFPTLSPIQTNQPDDDGFVTKLSRWGSYLLFSTYLGGNGRDQVYGIGLDTSGNAYLAGETLSSDFPTLRAYQTDPDGWGTSDAFVTELGATGGLLFSTYLGGTSNDQAGGIAVGAGGVYVAGATLSNDFPVESPYQADRPGQDAFVTKLDPSTPTLSLVFSTYLGGSDDDGAQVIEVDAAGAAYVAGWTGSTNFPVLSAFQPTSAGSTDAFVAKLAPDGGAIGYSSYLGGGGQDELGGLALGPADNAYIVGSTTSSDFPTRNAYQANQGGNDAFLVRLGYQADLSLEKDDSLDPTLVGVPLTYTLTVTNNGVDAATNVTVTDTLPANLTFVSASAGCSAAGQTVTCTAASLASGSNVAFTITVTPGLAAIPSVTNTASVTADQPDPVPANNTASQTTIVNPAADLAVSLTDSPDPVAVGGSLSYTLAVANAGPSTAASVTITDTLDPSTTFVSAPGCSHAAGVVSCNLGDLAASGNASVTITVTTTTAGAISNQASVASTTGDPDTSNNSATETTLVYETEAGGELPFFTATARSGEILLEWLSPGAPYVSTIIRFNTAPTFAACTPPASPDDGTPLVIQAGSAGTHDSYAHAGPLAGTTYCYAAFVHKGSGLVSGARTVMARLVGGPVLWGYSTGATATAPVAIGYGANAVSNDNVLHAMVRGSSGGNWPPNWTPFAMTGPAQHRPTSIPLAYGSATRQILLNSQDGRMYSVDAATGAPLWQTPSFGMLQAGTGGWLTAFGADEDRLLVGTRLIGADNTLYAIDPATQVSAWSFGPPANLIGPINAQVAVDYSLGYAYFTSEERSSGAFTVWCVNLRTHARVWARDLGSITSPPAYGNGHVYVGGDQGVSAPGTFYALNATTGATVWSFPTTGGAPNDYILADRLTNDVYFSTSSTVFSLSDTGAAYSLNWSTSTIANPSAPLYATGQDFLYVGSSDGRLWEINTAAPDPPSATKSVLLGDGLAGVGPPTRDNATSLIYLGSVAGVIYAVQQPLP